MHKKIETWKSDLTKAEDKTLSQEVWVPSKLYHLRCWWSRGKSLLLSGPPDLLKQQFIYSFSKHVLSANYAEGTAGQINFW
jgi:hypothetical protein